MKSGKESNIINSVNQQPPKMKIKAVTTYLPIINLETNSHNCPIKIQNTDAG